jgi:bacillithiol biosynthesis deacetylase BshB1
VKRWQKPKSQMSRTMKKILVISPHPDDAELAMGGTIAMMIELGWDVTVVDLTNGEPTPFGSKQLRIKETRRASKILGVRKRFCLEMPNRYLQATLENRRKLAEIIRLNCPDVLFGPILPDYHPDHVASVDIIHTARFEAKLRKTGMPGTAYWVPKQYGYYSTQRLCYDKPSFVVDISDFWRKKVEAVNAYQSQIKSVSSINRISLIEKMEIVCRYFGQCIGTRYAEPFISIEPLAVKRLNLLMDFITT